MALSKKAEKDASAATAKVTTPDVAAAAEDAAKNETATQASSNKSGRTTMIIFDWDDTLFATSALKEFIDGSPDEIRKAPCHPVWDQSCALLQNCVSALLRAAISMAPDLVYIITNSVEGWVEACMERYFPEVTPLLQKVHVVSARQYFMDHHSSGEKNSTIAQKGAADKVGLEGDGAQKPRPVTAADCLRWKALTFASLAMELWHPGVDGRAPQACAGKPVNVVSIGDSPIDHSAARFLERFLPGESWVKTVQLTQVPSREHLRDQQLLLVNSLRRIIDHPASATLWMSRRPTEQSSDETNESEKEAALDEATAIEDVAVAMAKTCTALNPAAAKDLDQEQTGAHHDDPGEQDSKGLARISPTMIEASASTKVAV